MKSIHKQTVQELETYPFIYMDHFLKVIRNMTKKDFETMKWYINQQIKIIEEDKIK